MMKYIFFGSSEFAKIVLEQLLQNNLRPVLIVTQPQKLQGRKQGLSPTPVQSIADKNKIICLTPENLNDEKFFETIQKTAPDFILLTAYGKIIPAALLKLPAKGFINLHPSLLPKYRGAAPIQSVILAGEKKTGNTLFLMDEQIDHGPIIRGIEYEIKNMAVTYSELMRELALLGAKLTLEILPQWLEGKIIPQPQDESLSTYCHKITPNDEKINWQLSADEIDKKIRAFNPNPGTYTVIRERVIKLIKGFPVIDNDLSIIKQTGEIFEYSWQGKKQIAVKCGSNFYVIQELKPAGKTIMNSYDFLNGNQWVKGLIIS